MNPNGAFDLIAARASHDASTMLRKARSRLTNNKALLPNVNGNSATARRFRDLVRAYVADMGGIENVGAVKLDLCRRLAGVSVMSEQLESLVVRAVDKGVLEGLITQNKFPLEQFCQLASTAVRLSSRLGLERVARDISPPPDPLRYAREIEATRQADDEAS